MNYANLKKSELIKLLEQRDARIEAAVVAYRALQAEHKAVAAHVHNTPTTKRPHLKAVKSFADKESLLAWAGDNIGKFIITHNAVSGELLASIREWR